MGLIHRWRLRAAFTLLALAAMAMTGVQPARAMSLGDTVRVHGYGSWAYKRVSNEGYIYAEGVEEGNYTNVSGTLNVSARPTENLMTVIQANWTLMRGRSLNESIFTFPLASPACAMAGPPPMGATECAVALPNGTLTIEPENEIELDYAFGEWTFSDALRLRAGQVKLPFGIYTEVFDVGTLRPFIDLPQGIYGPQGVVAEAYQGGGITGNVYLGDWNLQYDAYAGQVIAEIALTPTFRPDATISDVFGARLHITSPIEGLSFGTSGYFGLKSGQIFGRREIGSVGAHIEFLYEGFIFRTEGVYQRSEQTAEAAAAYVEMAYMFFDRLQLAGRLDYYKSKINSAFIAAALPTSIDRHVDYGVGLNYWFNNNFVIKTGYHYIDGNRYSLPENIGAFVTFAAPYTGGPLDESNHLFEAGAQFSF